MNHEKRRPVALEDLLRLKRMERPQEDFWADFDRQLRAKQLSALVEKRPWWHGLIAPHAFSVLRRYHLPLGATAALAVGFAAIRINQSEAPLAVGPLEQQSVAVGAALQSVSGGVDTGSIQVAPETTEAVAGLVLAEGRDSDMAAANDRSAPGELAPYLTAIGVGSEESATTSGMHGLRYAEPALLSSATADPVMARTLLTSTSRLEVQAIPSRPTVEPLHQITPPSERRGTRILTAMVSMASVEHAMRTTERAASRLSEEQLYDQIHRFGARGAGVNLKF